MPNEYPYQHKNKALVDNPSISITVCWYLVEVRTIIMQNKRHC
jgi:hypothetical protein